VHAGNKNDIKIVEIYLKCTGQRNLSTCLSIIYMLWCKWNCPRF